MLMPWHLLAAEHLKFPCGMGSASSNAGWPCQLGTKAKSGSLWSMRKEEHLESNLSHLSYMLFPDGK